MPRCRYQRLNDYVMGVIYSPLLLITAFLETRQAHKVRHNRRRGEDDDDTVEEWEQLSGMCDFEAEGWTKKVELTKPDVETNAAILEVRKLAAEIKELKGLIESMKREEIARVDG